MFCFHWPCINVVKRENELNYQIIACPAFPHATVKTKNRKQSVIWIFYTTWQGSTWIENHNYRGRLQKCIQNAKDFFEKGSHDLEERNCRCTRLQWRPRKRSKTVTVTRWFNAVPVYPDIIYYEKGLGEIKRVSLLTHGFYHFKSVTSVTVD